MGNEKWSKNLISWYPSNAERTVQKMAGWKMEEDSTEDGKKKLKQQQAKNGLGQR